MAHITENLEPQDVFRYFEEISAIPRPSGHEEAICDYLIAFAKEPALEWHRDAANNILLIKEASDGRAEEAPILLQGHMDMVCEKESGCAKDMEKEGLDLAVDGDWLSANGTTLGGDDGIAVAMILALLSDPTLSHPKLECIITTEEETGMGGAHGLDPTPLTGKRLLNIDSEEEGILTVGCAGGETYGVEFPLSYEEAEGVPMRITLDHLTGGHSGIEIDRGRGNADLLLLRVIGMLEKELSVRLCGIGGGSKNNAIPRTAEAIVLAENAGELQAAVASIEGILKNEYAVTDPELTLRCDPADDCCKDSCCCNAGSDATSGSSISCSVLTAESLKNVLALFAALPCGVQRMDQHLEKLVETSLNLGILKTDEQKLYAEYLLRSSVSSCLDALDEQMTRIIEAFGGIVKRADRYPAWEFAPDSPFRDKMVRIFREQYGKDPVVETVHAGLECGILSEKIPGLEAVSIGPDMIGIHTPEERLSISSTQRTYRFVRTIIEDTTA